MKVTDLKFFKSFLIEQKSSILNKTTEFRSEQLMEKLSAPDEAEAASHDILMNISLNLHERDRTSLFQIERALGKIEDGSYGICESCHDDIEARRLKARPFASLCVQCMEEKEDPRNFIQ